MSGRGGRRLSVLSSISAKLWGSTPRNTRKDAGPSDSEHRSQMIVTPPTAVRKPTMLRHSNAASGGDGASTARVSFIDLVDDEDDKEEKDGPYVTDDASAVVLFHSPRDFDGNDEVKDAEDDDTDAYDEAIDNVKDVWETDVLSWSSGGGGTVHVERRPRPVPPHIRHAHALEAALAEERAAITFMDVDEVDRATGREMRLTGGGGGAASNMSGDRRQHDDVDDKQMSDEDVDVVSTASSTLGSEWEWEYEFGDEGVDDEEGEEGSNAVAVVDAVGRTGVLPDDESHSVDRSVLQRSEMTSAPPTAANQRPFRFPHLPRYQKRGQREL